MKRLHVHVAVTDLDESIRFYSTLFGAAPTVVRPDYAKWLLEDPRVNFALSARGRAAGVDHLGIQVEDAAELEELRGRLAATGREVVDQRRVTCCYARSDKAWIADPQGVAWESFLSHGSSEHYGEDEETETRRVEALAAGACCARPGP